MHRIYRIGLLLSILLALAMPAAAQEFVFTAIPDQDESALVQRFNQVASYLSGKLNVKVRYIPVKSYEASITAFRNNQVQMAWFGGLSGVQARLAVPGSTAIAQGAEDTEFITYFIAHPSTGLKPGDSLPSSLQGMTFTFGSKGSTSGRLMPEFYIRKTFGKAPEDVFSRVGFSGDHSKTITLVESWAYQVGATNYAVYDRMVRDGKLDPKKVPIIWKTPTYPDYNWSVRGDVDNTFGAGFTKKVQQALLDMKDPELLKQFPRSSFVSASNDDYGPIQDTAKSIGIID